MPINPSIAREIANAALVDGYTFSKPPVLYAGLLTEPVVTNGVSVTGFTEVAGSGYERQPITFAPVSPEGLNSSSITVLFSDLPSADVVQIAVFNNLSGGDPYLWGNLSAPETIPAGDSYAIPAEAYTVAFFNPVVEA